LSTAFSASLFLLSSCGGNQDAGGYYGGPAEVVFGQITKGDATVNMEYASAIEGIANVEVRPQVSGYLSKIYVDEGAYVKAGQPLFKIDDQVYQEQLNTVLASLHSAESNLINAKIELHRKEELVKNKIVSNLQLDEAKATYQVAKSAVEQAKSAVKAAQINIGFSIVKAPVNGYVGRLNYKLGSLLAPSNVDPLTTVSDNSKVYAYFSLSENDFISFQKQYAGNTLQEKIKQTDSVRLILSDGMDYPMKGKIDAVDGQFNKSTGAITMRAIFDNKSDFLRSGNTGKVVLSRNLNEVLLLPIAATVAYQDMLFLYTTDAEGKVVQLPVTTMGKAGDNYILGAGFAAGDKYIAQGFERLQQGMPVVEKAQSDHKY